MLDALRATDDEEIDALTSPLLCHYVMTEDISNTAVPMRIRVRIDPPHPLVCRKRRLNWAVLRMRPEKPRSRVTAGVAR
jgi:hypothetical protein